MGAVVGVSGKMVGGVLGSNLHFTHFHCSVQGFNLILNILKVFNDMDEISPDC